MNDSTERQTIPSPAPGASAEVAAYIRASERVAAAIREQRECIEALRALDSRHPAVIL